MPAERKRTAAAVGPVWPRHPQRGVAPEGSSVPFRQQVALDGDVAVDPLDDIPAAAGALVARPVSTKVNNVRYDQPDAIREEPRLPSGE